MIGKATVFMRTFYDNQLYSFGQIPASEVEVICPDLDLGSVSQQRQEQRRHDSMASVTTMRQPVYYPKFLDPIRLATGHVTLNSPYIYRDIDKIVSSSDIVISIEPHTYYSAHISKACGRLGIPLVITSETSIHSIVHRALPYSAFSRMTTRVAKVLVACTRRAEQYLAELSVEQERVVRCPVSAVDPGEFTPARRENLDGTFKVLFVGRLEVEKGIDLLLQALEELSHESNVELTVVGSGPLSGQLLRRWDFPVVHIPFLPGNLYPSVFSRSDVLCLPSRTLTVFGMSRWEEVFGVAAYEAMSAGLPIVVSDSGNLPDMAGELNPVVRGPNESGLVSALRYLAADPKRRVAIGERNRAEALREFEPRVLRSKWTEVVKRCIE